MGLLDLFGHKYPDTNFHELNLDWCITSILDMQAAWKGFTAGNKLIFADPLQHDLTKTYAKNTIVVDPVSGSAYLSLDVVSKGVQLDNEDYWLPVFDFAGYITRANQNFTDNYFSGTDRTPIPLVVGDWVVLDDVLYKVAVAMAADDLFIIDTNIIHFTVEQFLKDFITSVDQTLYNYSLTIQQYKDDIDASELAYRQQLARDIEDTTALLQAELDTIIHSATSDTEILDARVGYNSIIYDTLGNAIRNQVDDLHSEFKNSIGLQQLIVRSNTTGSVNTNFVFEIGQGYKVINHGPGKFEAETWTNGARVERIGPWNAPTIENGDSVYFVPQQNADVFHLYFNTQDTTGYTECEMLYGEEILREIAGHFNIVNGYESEAVDINIGNYVWGHHQYETPPDRISSDFIKVESGSSIELAAITGWQFKYQVFSVPDFDTSPISETSFANSLYYSNPTTQDRYIHIAAKKTDDTRTLPYMLNGVNIIKTVAFPLYYDWKNPFYMKGTESDDCVVKYNSTSRFNDITKFYDVLADTFGNITKDSIGTSQTPDGEWADIDSNTYPLNIYKIRGLKTATATENLIILCSGIHGDDSFTDPQVAGDAMDGLCALAYFVKKLMFEWEGDALLSYIRNYCNLLIYPIMNPWGIQNGYRCNGRGVDLNRNFDDDWVSMTQYGYSSGTSAASEAETQAWQTYLNDTVGVGGAKFLMEVHSRGGSMIHPSAARWLMLYCDADQQTMLENVGKLLKNQFGGNYDVHGLTTSGQAYLYAYDVVSIPSAEPECFSGYEDNNDTRHSLESMMQDCGFLSSLIKYMTYTYILN